ncbi:unnamed protein product [Paramecium sonneborni]|uniref:DUF4378 domain-containing protein n=1 Tax=Paramecium sonneborni TaxID=65129 RepID=A0A8S1PL76_9CILI|nr:unnamed protein product [Paramecium sonneborni]
MNKQRRQKILPIQQLQAKLKQLKQSIKASEIKSLRSSCLFTETTPIDKVEKIKKLNANSSVDGKTMYIKPNFKTKMKTTKSPQSMKLKTSSVLTQKKKVYSPQKPLKDILKYYIKSKIPKSRTPSKSPPQNIKKLSSPLQRQSSPPQRQIRSQSKKKIKQKTTVSSPNKKNKKQKTQNQYYQPQISKISSIRLNTFSVSEDPHKMLMNQIIDELQLMNEKQIIELQSFLKNIKKEKIDEALQTSIHQKIDVQLKHQQKAFNECLPLNIINEICSQRESTLNLRVQMQIDAFSTLLEQQKISPRSFNQNGQVLNQWKSQSTDKLHKCQELLQKIQNVTNKIQQKTTQDLKIIQELQSNNSVVIQQLQQMSCDSSYLESQDQFLSFLNQNQQGDFRKKDMNFDFQVPIYDLEIQTNVGTVNLFIELLCVYILNNNLNEFIKRMNYPYGLSPYDKIRKIHGYNIIQDKQYENPIQETSFQEIQQSSNPYELIHNRAIFDTFNEILNGFRPFYQCQGQPYPWEWEGNLVVILYNEENVNLLLEKGKERIIQYASTLCGLINDDDDNVQSSINYEEVMQSLMNNDYLQQLRNERLQQSINKELEEKQNEWRQDKTETLFEITDFIFEDLINELMIELH